MEETKKVDSHLTSAAAFVEGGIQDACEDACSICLEAFCDSDPSTAISLKDPTRFQSNFCTAVSIHFSAILLLSLFITADIHYVAACSQELLEAVEQERSFRVNQSRNTAIFHHPTLGDFELQHLPVGANDSELEERIIQHLAAAAAMGRAHHLARREGHRSRSGTHGRPQFLVFSAHPNAPPVGPVSALTAQREGDNDHAPTPLATVGEETSQQVAQLPPIQSEQAPTSVSGPSVVLVNRPGVSNNRYKESISKGTRGWKERLFSRTSIGDLGSEVKREVNAGIASVSRMMERLDTRENSRASDTSAAHCPESSSVTGPSNQRITENHCNDIPSGSNSSASCAASPSQN
ncbi:hypothetical protein ACLOJK_040731 [Asimina triloba]